MNSENVTIATTLTVPAVILGLVPSLTVGTVSNIEPYRLGAAEVMVRFRVLVAEPVTVDPIGLIGSTLANATTPKALETLVPESVNVNVVEVVTAVVTMAQYTLAVLPDVVCPTSV